MINYYLITKPGIILGNLITVAAGFALGSKDGFNVWLFLATLVGLTFIIASACVFNNYIDRSIDKKMHRTKNRPLVKGLITGKNALLFGSVIGIIGFIILMTLTNLLTTAVAAFGFFVYVLLYSVWKSRTIFATAIGSISGALPPVIGYCSASGQFDAAAAILFAMMVLWQMPHFFAIALMHLDDYKKAGIPVLPIVKGIRQTKIHMTLYILAFIPLNMMLTFYHYTGYTYLVSTTAFALAWLILCLQGFNITNYQQWGKQMFRLSLAMIMVMCLVMPFDTL